jgi:TraM recognition site of TraD and TraG
MPLLPRRAPLEATAKTVSDPYHPQTILRDWSAVSPGAAFRISDAVTGVAVFGATGSGKTSGPAKHLALSYLAHGFGGLVLCAKPEERRQWQEWAAQTNRTDDLCIVDKSGEYRFNFLNWEASRTGDGGGLTLNIVALLDEIAGAIAGKGESSGDNQFFQDAMHHMCMNLVDLALFASIPVSLPLLRSIVNSAPQTLEETKSETWQQESACAAILREADEKTQANGDEDERADFEECRAYWLQEFPVLSGKTRSIITLLFSMLARPFMTRPLRRLFATDTTITPEAAFEGKIIIVDLPVQEYRLAGRVANLAWKYCYQMAVLRRQSISGKPLRPSFMWLDEAQNFVTKTDSEYHAVARSAGGCSVFLMQTREALRSALGNDDAVDALLANLQCKFFCQSSSTETNEWASLLLGERWQSISSLSAGSQSNPNGPPGSSGGVSISEQQRRHIDPAVFATLKRGGERHGYQVEAIVYNGGHLFQSQDGEESPCAFLTFDQRD